jgi:hypothetical protein
MASRTALSVFVGVGSSCALAVGSGLDVELAIAEGLAVAVDPAQPARSSAQATISAIAGRITPRRPKARPGFLNLGGAPSIVDSAGQRDDPALGVDRGLAP